MMIKRHRAEGMAARWPFIAALWTLIAVALLSALAPLGPPLSRVTGSAFNPATADVVLKARAPVSSDLVQALLPDGAGRDIPVSAAWWAVVTMPLLFWRVAVSGRPFAADVRPLRSALLSRRRARAPPALS